MPYAIGATINRGHPLSFKPSAAEIASTTHTVSNAAEPGCLSVVVAVTAASGTTPTMTVVVEGSDDAATWTTLGTIGANGYSVGPLATAPSNFTGAATMRAFYVSPQFVRTRSVIGGTTPSFTYSVTASVS